MSASSKYEFWYYVSVGVGLAIATASFMMMAGLFEVVPGLWVALAVVGASLLCASIAAAVAEQASLFPGSSGLRTYFKASLGNRRSLFLVYNYLAFVVLVAGIESYLFSRVIHVAWPSLPPLAASMTVFAATILLNLLGLEVPRVVQVVATVVLVVIMGLLGFAGIVLSRDPGAVVRATFQGAGLQSALLLPAAIGMAFFLLVGFEWITPLGFRPQSYERLIPRAMFVTIAINAVLNAVFVIALAVQYPRESIAADPLPQIRLAVTLAGERAGVSIAVLLSTLAIASTFNAGLLGGSRLIYALAREGYFFKFCARISPRGVTYGSILGLGGVSILTCLVVSRFGWELAAAVVGSAIVCFVYAALLLSLVRLRHLRPDQRRGYRSPVPVWLCWALIVVMPLLGVASLLTTPGVGQGPALGFVLCALVCGAFTWRFSARGNHPRSTSPRPSELPSVGV